MIYGLMVTRNEGGRYLESVLASVSNVVDDLVILDDGSTDDTMDIIKQGGYPHCHLDTEDEPLFIKNESLIRQISLELLNVALRPSTDDWVFCIDADEYLSSEEPREDLERLAGVDGATSYEFPVAEVFKIVNDKPYIRIDGFWDDIWANRFFRWQDSPHIEDKSMASGSVPESVRAVKKKAESPTILHYGYATEEDRVKKYARYIGVSGHSVQHIDSILRSPMLRGWNGPKMIL